MEKVKQVEAQKEIFLVVSRSEVHFVFVRQFLCMLD